MKRCKRTRAYSDSYRGMTASSARAWNRRVGNTEWYRWNKDALVATFVLNHLVGRIQRMYRHRADAMRNRACPISLVAISDIPVGNRFRHVNSWFDRAVLAQHIHQTSDFFNPVTRVEFREDDVLRIDPKLVDRFRNRKKIRARFTADVALVQTIENELEEIFSCMVNASQQIPSMLEFTVVLDSLMGAFQQCHRDLLRLDDARSGLCLKSLRDFVEGDPNRPVHMPSKRKSILLHFLRSQV
ncbi:unnamed protein product [Pylaiella littoralis]